MLDRELNWRIQPGGSLGWSKYGALQQSGWQCAGFTRVEERAGEDVETLGWRGCRIVGPNGCTVCGFNGQPLDTFCKIGSGLQPETSIQSPQRGDIYPGYVAYGKKHAPQVAQSNPVDLVAAAWGEAVIMRVCVLAICIVQRIPENGVSVACGMTGEQPNTFAAKVLGFLQRLEDRPFLPRHTMMQ